MDREVEGHTISYFFSLMTSSPSRKFSRALNWHAAAEPPGNFVVEGASPGTTCQCLKQGMEKTEAAIAVEEKMVSGHQPP